MLVPQPFEGFGCWRLTAGGWAAPPVWTAPQPHFMELQHYAMKPPYTRTYFTVPSHVQDTPRRNGLSPVQADGECLTALIMAAHYGPSEEAELPMGLFEPFL